MIRVTHAIFFILFFTVPGVPYNVSIGAVNMAGLGVLNANIYFTKELSMIIIVVRKRSKKLYHIFSTKYCFKECESKPDLCKYDDGVLDSLESL